MLFVNFKTYREGSGLEAIKLVRLIEEVAASCQVKIVPVLQATDLKEAVAISKLEIWVQNVDLAGYGAHTGAILSEAVFEDGAAGTFLNHSERKLTSLSDLEKINQRALLVGLKTLIFAGNLEEMKNVCAFKPTYIAYEPAQFIGSTTTSVAREQPEIINQAVEMAKVLALPLIVGAGIKSAEDVRKSIELGAAGVVVASDVVKAENPRQELLDLVEGFK